MNFTNTSVYNINNAINGMRNPLCSWKLSDSNGNEIGEKDLNLAQNLIKAGPEHAKFLRQIFISVDIEAPRFWWNQLDTYKIGTAANSTSTMHTLTKQKISRSDFSFNANFNELVVSFGKSIDGEWEFTVEDYIEDIIDMCENLRQLYMKTGDKKYWEALIQILPQSYIQTRTWTANYAVLRNIYFQRRNHKLKEWEEFCKWVERLPYAKELIILEDK